MKKVFVSYAHEDRPFVAQLAPALAQSGYEVWWDRELEGGDAFRAKIEESLNAADAVVVVWSGRSRASRWVLDEAEKGLQRNVLVPVRVDKSALPLGFGGLHTLDFSAWNGAADARVFTELADRIAKVSAAAPDVQRRRAFFSLAWGLLLGVAVGLAFAAAGVALDLGFGGVTAETMTTSALLGVGSALPVALWAAVRARRFAQSNPIAVLTRMLRTYSIAALFALLLVVVVSALSAETIQAKMASERFGEIAGVVLVGTLIFGAAIAIINGLMYALARAQRAA
ncbi:MAG: hypothetical protein A4S17_05335 [Proteobacteria bacterium HN_bin10]|nr:MAG: hypothetical protein A4S17_05335 [Proteobacteria bacterium HN_bin10]